MERRVVVALLGALGVVWVVGSCAGGAEGSSGGQGGEGGTSTASTTGATTGVAPVGAGGGNSGGGDGGAGGVAGAGGATGTGGGSAGACADVSGDYGLCDAEIGWGFDGAECKLFSGCNCAPNCDSFYKDAVECATSCAAAGKCDTAAMKAMYLAQDPFVAGNHCDGVYVCTPDQSQAYLEAMFPGIVCEGECAGHPSCAAYYNGTVTDEAFEKLCAVSLLPAVDTINCVVYGP